MPATVTIPDGSTALRAGRGPLQLLAAAALSLVLGSVALPAAAAPVSVAAASAAISAVAPAAVTYGSLVTVSGTLTDPAGAAMPAENVVAEARTADGRWTVVAGPAVTDAAGSVALTLQPSASTVVRLRHDDPEGASSREVTIAVQAALTAAADRSDVRAGRPVRISGTVAPAPPGATVRLERRAAGSWVKVAGVAVTDDGTWSTTVTPGPAGFVRYRAIRRADSGVQAAAVELAPLDVFRLHRYTVVTRGRIVADVGRFRAVLAATYADPRGWARAHHRFREVPRGGDFTVVLAQAASVPSYHPICSSFYSCRVGRYVIVNQDRWRHGSPYVPGDLLSYRQMVINHETGHWLGRGHASCPGAGRAAPVMMQQSKGLHGCRLNPWPLPGEIRAVS